MDVLEIKSLKIAARIGVHAWEQRIDQDLFIDISLPIDLSHCPDELAQTIDYAAVCQAVTAHVQSQPFQLIETVAESVAQLLKRQFNLSTVTISVSKPQAIKNAADVRVTIAR